MRTARLGFGTLAAGGLFMAACRLWAGFAAAWQARAALPLLNALHGLTARAPFPLIEPLALLAFAGTVAACLKSPRRALAALVALALGAAMPCALLWVPAYWTRGAAAERASTARVERLCATLSEALSVDGPSFLSPREAAARAPGVAGMPRARVKPARWPEWMNALRLAGLFAPWTGEVIVNPDAPPGFVPFTCVHELMHLSGIADEGAANIAAWRACLSAGGAFADSARLWALRYGLARLAAENPAALRRALRRMDAGLAALLFRGAEGLSRRPAWLPARLLGIAEGTADYDALLDWLAARADAPGSAPAA